MAGIRFEWGPAKSRANQWKHGVSFEEAQSVFFDDRALFMADPEHSDDEDRFLLLGLSIALRVILVCHCFRDDDQTIRIIHARRATKAEHEQYWSRVQ